MLCATLARVRRPATGRLNSGVRRQKSISQLIARLGNTIGFGLHCSSDRFSVRFRFGHIRLARSGIACGALTGFGCNGQLAAGFFAPDAIASETAGGKFVGALEHLGFGFRQARHSFTLAGFLPA